MTFSIDVNGLIPTQTYEPTGKVQLYVDGTPYNAPITIDVNGQATVALADLPVGTTSVWARYLGDAKYKPASSEALQQVVKKRTPTASTTTIDDPGTVVTGQSKGYKITVAPASFPDQWRPDRSR
ncbi:Ig-like domain-containing protein [Aeromicrobium sp. UC242_57]|uniref:Ig-like domain-containing protein n=1 Tax=Aeromicrobium sp. UC242_57 TaxID=3374624 RepID=UPI003788A9C9